MSHSREVTVGFGVVWRRFLCTIACESHFWLIRTQINKVNQSKSIKWKHAENNRTQIENECSKYRLVSDPGCPWLSMVCGVWFVILFCSMKPLNPKHLGIPSQAQWVRSMAWLLVAAACGHGSMIMPPSRNSIDATLPAWSDGKHPETGLIE